MRYYRIMHMLCIERPAIASIDTSMTLQTESAEEYRCRASSAPLNKCWQTLPGCQQYDVQCSESMDGVRTVNSNLNLISNMQQPSTCCVHKLHSYIGVASKTNVHAMQACISTGYAAMHRTASGLPFEPGRAVNQPPYFHTILCQTSD